MLNTPEQYVESLKDGRVVYQDGERIKDVPSYPGYKRAVERAASEYAVARMPQYRDLFVVEGDDEEYPMLYKLPTTGEDLQKRRLIIQALSRWNAGGAKWTGIDGLNGVDHVAHKMDAALGTNYGERVTIFRKHCQHTDPGIVAAVSDPKGNRKLHAQDPQQKHKDFYLRIVDRNSDGIFISGCKLHITGVLWANEIVCLPSRNHNESGKDYAVACAVPCNAKGVTFIGTSAEVRHAGSDPMIIFDNVFVPNERVFMNGEWQFSRDMAFSFARYHRLAGGTGHGVVLNQLVGLAMLMAEYNGLTHATRIQDMLAWLVTYAEIEEALGRAAALNAETDPESGFAIPNKTWANCSKWWYATHWHQANKYLQDITGGIAATMPSMKDWENPEIRPYIDKYLAGDAKYPTEERLRALNMVREMGSGQEGITVIHGEGSMAAQMKTIFLEADWERYKASAKKSMGLPTDHPDYKDIPTDFLYKLPG